MRKYDKAIKLVLKRIRSSSVPEQVEALSRAVLTLQKANSLNEEATISFEITAEEVRGVETLKEKLIGTLQRYAYLPPAQLREAVRRFDDCAHDTINGVILERESRESRLLSDLDARR